MKKDFKIFRKIILFVSCMVAVVLVRAQEPIAEEETALEEKMEEPEMTVEVQDTTEIILTVPEYAEWERVSISGKLRMQGLPLSPGIKIFMEKDSSIFISIKAPLMGEVGRLEITSDSLLIVNKMKKTFAQESLVDFMRYFPGTIRDIQELILGRIVMPGTGVLTPDNSALIEIIDNGEELFAVPAEEILIPGIDYGYMIDEEFVPSVLLVLPDEGRDDIAITLNYSFGKKSYTLDFAYQEGTRGIEVILDLDEPEWSGTSPSPVKIDKKYRQLSLLDFMRSF